MNFHPSGHILNNLQFSAQFPNLSGQAITLKRQAFQFAAQRALRGFQGVNPRHEPFSRGITR